MTGRTYVNITELYQLKKQANQVVQISENT